MSHEHSIDDILQMLKNSVQDDAAPKDGADTQDASAHTLSDEELKQQLKRQYASEAPLESEENAYAIDHSFFEEVGREDAPQETPVESESAETSVVTLMEVEEKEEEETVEVEPEEHSDLSDEESDDTLDDFLEEFFEDTESIAPWEEPISSEPFDEPLQASAEASIEQWETEPQKELILQEIPKTEEAYESDILWEDDALEAESFPEIQTVELTDLLCDYESEEAFSFSESLSLTQADMLEEPPVESGFEQIHESVFDLMLQLGCDDELNLSWDDTISEEFKAEPKSADSESLRAERIESMQRNYQKKKKQKLWLLIASLTMTVLIFFYDTLPVLGFEFLGIVSHMEYPGAYMMLGFQLVLIHALLLGRSLLRGAKKLFTFRPDLYSMVVLLLIFTLLYDVTMALVSHTTFPPTFHFSTALIMLFVVIGEYVLIRREATVFSLYTSDNETYRYTLRESQGDSSIAEQMYAGGLDRSKNVYIPMSAEESHTTFKPVAEHAMESGWIRGTMLPIAFISILLMIVAILLQSSIDVAALTVMTVLFTTLPLHTVFAVCMPLCVSAHRLQKRGIAVTGKTGMDAYAHGDIIVYNDLHLFRPCTAKDIGIVFLEQAQATLVLGCLEKLYSQIGGPLKDVFSDVPEEYRLNNIRIRRIFRNGLEAFVDKKHILLVGDVSFMRRYGLSFPMEKESKGRSTLCVSLDKKVSAKMSIRYTVEPIFEMLAERLSKEGIHVVIETFDPMIQASMLQSLRTLGNSPISVFHKNVSYLHSKPSLLAEAAEVGMVATSSRLKLAEAVVWCKKMRLISQWNTAWTAIFSVLGLIGSMLTLMFGWLEFIHQYWLLLFSVLSHIAILITSIAMMPKKDYFTVGACEAYLCKQSKQQKNKIKRKKHHE